MRKIGIVFVFAACLSVAAPRQASAQAGESWCYASQRTINFYQGVVDNLRSWGMDSGAIFDWALRMLGDEGNWYERNCTSNNGGNGYEWIQ